MESRTNGGPEPEPSKPSTDDRRDIDDPVVHEIPVFLSHGTPLYLFQYPVRPASMPYDQAEVMGARFRPVNKQVELEISLDTTQANYDRSKGEQIKLNVDGSEGGINRPDSVFQSNVMDKQVLAGTAAVTDCKRYAVGILNDNELHLTKVEGVLSLRPSLTYLDKSDKTAKAEGRLTDPDDPTDDNEVKTEAVTVKFARGDPEKNKRWKEKSYEFQLAKQSEEPWEEMNFNQMKSRSWEEESQGMFCSAMDTDVKDLDLPPDKYLSALKDDGDG